MATYDFTLGMKDGLYYIDIKEIYFSSEEDEDIASAMGELSLGDSVFDKPEAFRADIIQMLGEPTHPGLGQQHAHLLTLLDPSTSTLTEALLEQARDMTSRLPGLLASASGSAQLPHVFFFTLLSLSIAGNLISSEHDEGKRDLFRRLLLTQLQQLIKSWPKDQNELLLTKSFKTNKHADFYISRENLMRIFNEMAVGHLQPVQHAPDDDETSAVMSEADEDDDEDFLEPASITKPPQPASGSAAKPNFSSITPPDTDNPFYKIHLYFIEKIGRPSGDFQERREDFVNLLNVLQASEDMTELTSKLKVYHKTKPAFSGGFFKRVFRSNEYAMLRNNELLILPVQSLTPLCEEYCNWLRKVSVSKASPTEPNELNSIHIALSILKNLQPVSARVAASSSSTLRPS